MNAISLSKRRLQIVLAVGVAAIVVTASFAGRASAAPGPYFEPTVGCSNTSLTLEMTGSANAQPGFTTQWMTAQFAYRNIDKTTAFTYTPWRNFQNVYRNFGNGISSSVPGDTTVRYTVTSGHYEVFVRYMWWNGSKWTDMTAWVRSYHYGYDDYISGVNFPTVLGSNCPVGI
jgi:hypothetical protein